MKLEISKRKTEKFTNMQQLKNTFLNNQQAKKEISQETLEKSIFFQTKENENTIYQNLQDTMKDAFRGKCIALNTYKKGKNLNNLIL